MDNLTTNTPEMPVIVIQLTQGYSTVVDAVDSDLNALKWYPKIKRTRCYAMRTVKKDKQKKTVHLHTVILCRMLGRDLVKGEMVDHIDGDGLNNQRSNLRLATHTENLRNQRIRRDNTSGFKGVSWSKASGKWVAQIRMTGKIKYLGSFTTPEEAYAAYCAAALELHGEFARFK
jgi:hypothetical protein